MLFPEKNQVHSWEVYSWKRVNSTAPGVLLVLYHIIMCLLCVFWFLDVPLTSHLVARTWMLYTTGYILNSQNWSCVKFRHGFHTYSLQSIVLLLKWFSSNHLWVFSSTLWFWIFSGSLRPRLIGEYIIPGSKSLFPYHKVVMSFSLNISHWWMHSWF